MTGRFCSQTCRIAGMVGKPQSPELAQRRGDGVRRHYEKHPESRERVSRQRMGHPVSAEVRTRVGAANRGRKHPSPSPELVALRFARGFNRPDVQARRKATLRSPEYRAKRSAIAVRNMARMPHRLTSIERMLRDELERRGLKFVMQKAVLERFLADFVFEGAHLIVEADGDYWHSRPEQIARDTRRNAALRAAGYTVLRFWERDIKADVAACADQVAALLGDGGE